jgi:hypothetical protein
MKSYSEFLKVKEQQRKPAGFEPLWLSPKLFDFQRVLTEWAVRTGRGALLCDCGLGKSAMECIFGENVVRKTSGRVLLLTPLAVGPQMIREAEKFGVEAHRIKGKKLWPGINVLNYQRLHHLDPADFDGIICDEVGCCKDFDSQTRKFVSAFAHRLPYRLLATATPAPNDYVELGSSSDVLGVVTKARMLGTFFSPLMGPQNTGSKWELKGHARRRFWQWVAGWARACRKPSDLGFPDGAFQLPPLRVKHHTVPSKANGGFFPTLARTLNQQRRERRDTLQARCELAASLVPEDRPCVLFCHLNPEGDLLEKLIPDAVQVAGRHTDEEKEERLDAFSQGQVRVLVSKPVLAGWGLNWQHCSDVIYFPSWSMESYYQCIRRCWRFGQEREVTVHVVSSEAERRVVDGLLLKERQMSAMYDGIIASMKEVLRVTGGNGFLESEEVEVPAWLGNGRRR